MFKLVIQCAGVGHNIVDVTVFYYYSLLCIDVAVAMIIHWYKRVKHQQTALAVSSMDVNNDCLK